MSKCSPDGSRFSHSPDPIALRSVETMKSVFIGPKERNWLANSIIRGSEFTPRLYRGFWLWNCSLHFNLFLMSSSWFVKKTESRNRAVLGRAGALVNSKMPEGFWSQVVQPNGDMSEKNSHQFLLNSDCVCWTIAANIGVFEGPLFNKNLMSWLRKK